MLSQAADALNVKMSGADVLFNAVSKDTRSITAGDLYVAIKGENFDGHKFVSQAKTAGAVAAMVSDVQAVELPQLCVDDTRLALGVLASHWARQWRAQSKASSVNKNNLKKMIGITGSNGKTTVKGMCGSIFAQAVGDEFVLVTQGNLNNDIGMPLTLLSLREQHRYAVIEMGANHSGEIDYLSRLASPDIAIVTNAGAAHLEGFGTLENVATAKAEIFNGLAEQGTAIINADDSFSKKWLALSSSKKQMTFSMKHEDADCYASEGEAGVYTFNLPVGSVDVLLTVPGEHNVMNALAAASAACAAGINLKAIETGLNAFENIQGRLKINSMACGTKVIDDSYNANPCSMRAAIDVLAAYPNKKTVLVLGDMGELGAGSSQLHAQIGDYAKQLKLHALYATGEQSLNAVKAFGAGAEHFENKNSLLKALSEKLKGNEIVLVKGSRSAKMEDIVSALLSMSSVNGGELGDGINGDGIHSNGMRAN